MDLLQSHTLGALCRVYRDGSTDDDELSGCYCTGSGWDVAGLDRINVIWPASNDKYAPGNTSAAEQPSRRVIPHRRTQCVSP